MSKNNRKAAILICATMSLNVSASEAIHIVKSGESLSLILFKNQLKPIYGKGGALNEALSLNPRILHRKNYRIYPGEKIKFAIVNSENEITSVKQKPSLEERLPQVNSPKVEEIKSTKIESAPEISSHQPVNTSEDRFPSDDFKQGFFWKLAPTLSWKNLSSTDENIYRQSNIQALTRTCYGASVTYGMHFEENLDFYSKFLLEVVPFQSDSSISLTQKNFLSTSLAFGGVFQKKYAVELGMEDQYFLTSSSLSSIEIKKVTLPRVNFSYAKDLYQSRKASIGAVFSGRAFIPRSSSELQMELGLGGGAEFQFKLLNQSFGIGYDYNVLKSQSNSTNAQNVFWKYLWETP